jgi:hypothetical protein
MAIALILVSAIVWSIPTVVTARPPGAFGGGATAGDPIGGERGPDYQPSGGQVLGDSSVLWGAETPEQSPTLAGPSSTTSKFLTLGLNFFRFGGGLTYGITLSPHLWENLGGLIGSKK